jgi:undecaprenyl-diphosphatase
VTLFEVLNAPAGANSTVIAVATFCALRLIWLVPILLASYWLCGDRDMKRSVVAATLAGFLALLIAQVCGLYYTPRPFAAGVGRTLLLHAPDSSFPSDHATLMAAVAISLSAIRVTRLPGLVLAVLWLPQAWARIYLGVHFPSDMFGALVVGVFAVFCVKTWGTPAIDFLFPHLLQLYLVAFRPLIRRKWFR